MFKIIRNVIKYSYFLFFLISTLFLIPIFLQDIQFLPLALRVFNFFSLISIIIFLLLIITTMILGRYYCQYICPFGIFQDILPYFKNNFSLFSNKKIKYITRILFFILLILGLYSYIEPYSLFTKIIVYPINTFYFWVYDYLIVFLKKIKIYLSPLKYHIDFVLFFINLGLLFFIFIINLFKKRFFCNYVCPTGTILYGISKYPVFKINFTTNCISCGVCEKICPTLAIDSNNKKIDNGECVLCMRCIELCKFNGITYKPILNNISYEKRKFIFGLTFLPILLIFKKSGLSINRIFFPKNMNSIVIPPGAKSFDNLSSKCISCSLCVIQCPTKVIRFENYLPILDYNQKYCLYECKRCSEVCPVDAIKEITLSEKKITQIGISNFILKRCIVYTKETDCGACSEHCPTKAVNMVPYKNNLLIPKVNEKICIGCGACQYACPTNPKAIIVKANSVHKKALLPANKIKDNNMFEQKNNEFPF